MRRIASSGRSSSRYRRICCSRSRSAVPYSRYPAAVRADGFSYLVVNFSELERLQAMYAILTAAEREKLLLFLRTLTPEFRQGPLGVYRTG